MIGDDGPVRAIGDFVSRFGPQRAQPVEVADVAAPASIRAQQTTYKIVDEGRLRYRSGGSVR